MIRRFPLFLREDGLAGKNVSPGCVVRSREFDAMQRYVCIHCHFYQPPRENPWLEAVELQDSASPYHDWNERVTAECYLPNGAARILDGQSRIAKIVNNYARISFNFGPTLLSWMEHNAPHAYERVLEADRQSRNRSRAMEPH